jgi:hypothetical protein
MAADSVLSSTAPPAPPMAVFIIKNIAVDGTPFVTLHVWAPSIFHTSDPGFH